MTRSPPVASGSVATSTAHTSGSDHAGTEQDRSDEGPAIPAPGAVVRAGGRHQSALVHRKVIRHKSESCHDPCDEDTDRQRRLPRAGQSRHTRSQSGRNTDRNPCAIHFSGNSAASTRRGSGSCACEDPHAGDELQDDERRVHDRRRALARTGQGRAERDADQRAGHDAQHEDRDEERPATGVGRQLHPEQHDPDGEHQRGLRHRAHERHRRPCR